MRYTHKCDVEKMEKILKLDESCISNPKSRNPKLDGHTFTPPPVQSDILDFGFEVQDSSNFKMSPPDR